MTEIIILSIALGCWGWLYCARLTDVGEVFGWVPNVVNWLFGYKWGFIVDPSKMSLPHYTVTKWTYACSKCHTGFVALWSYPIIFEYDLKEHFVYLIFAMTIATILTENIGNEHY
jgi:hypothetical protein